MPLVATKETVGVLGLYPEESKEYLHPENRHVLDMFVKQTALAVEGARLAAINVKAEAEIERSRFRNFLFDSSSFDVRRSIRTISRIVDELSDNDPKKHSEQIARLREEIREMTEMSEAIPGIIEETNG